MGVGARDRSPLAGYRHLLKAAERLQWDERDLVFTGDVVPDDPVLRQLVAGFVVAEAAVAEHLPPFAAAAEDPLLAACFGVQTRDEERHARFFERAWRELFNSGGDGVAAMAGAARHDAGPALCALFEEELPRRAAALAAGAPLAHAVGLYHLVLEAVVFAAGQAALLERLRAHGTMPGLTKGVERVQADERWHIGLGVQCLADAGAAELDLEEPLVLAARAWPPEVAVDLSGHLRRLRLAHQGDLNGVPDLGDVVVDRLHRPV